MLSLKEGLDILQTSFVDCSLRAQVVSNDLSRGLFPARDLRLLVVDEAHRAQGDYAYCHVVRELTREARMEREWNQHCSHCNKLTVSLDSSGRYTRSSRYTGTNGGLSGKVSSTMELMIHETLSLRQS